MHQTPFSQSVTQDSNRKTLTESFIPEIFTYTCTCISPFPNEKFFDSSKLGEFTDGNFKFDEMAESSPKG